MIPESMKASGQWCNWRYILRDGEPTKVPFQPNGSPAKSNDPGTWATFAECNGRGQFVGFFLGGGWFGVDLDNCLVDGELLPWAAEIVERFPAAYIEVSPSGKGAKLFCRGAPPEMKGRKKIVEKIEGGKARAIEVYANGRYFAVTGEAMQAVEPGDCSAALAWLLERHWPTTTTPTQPTVTYHAQTPIEERARLYLERCEPAVSGCGGHNRTFHVAGQLVHGFALSEDAAFQLLQAWNARCEPPWSETDLRRKVGEAAKAPCDKPRGWLRDANEWEASRIVDLSGFMVHQAIGGDVAALMEDEDGPSDPGEMPSDIVTHAPGILGEIVRHDLRISLDPQPNLALAGALAALSAITGRKVAGFKDIRTNLLIVGLAPSGAGKNHARKVMKKILNSAGARRLLGPERIGSHAGILSRLKDEPCTLFPIDEVGDLFSLIKANGGKLGALANIEPVLKALYSSADDPCFIGDALANTDHVKSVAYPHLVLHGVCPAANYWGNLTAANVENGLIARFLVFEGQDAPSAWIEDDNDEPPQHVTEFFRRWFTFEPGSNLAAMTPIAKRAEYEEGAAMLFREHRQAIKERQSREDERTRAIWNRCAEKTSKLALLAACAQCPDPAELPIRVTTEHMRWGKSLAIWSTRRMVFSVAENVADNAEDERKKRLLKVIPVWPAEIDRQRLTKKTKWLKGSERRACLEDLCESRLVKAREERAQSGPSRVFFSRLK
jgi:hypothetical protein